MLYFHEIKLLQKRKPPTISIHCTDEIGESYSDLLYVYVNALGVRLGTNV